MKKIFFFIAFVSTTFIYAQDQNAPVNEPIFEMKDVDVQPEFPGGIDNFYNFFRTYPFYGMLIIFFILAF